MPDATTTTRLPPGVDSPLDPDEPGVLAVAARLRLGTTRLARKLRTEAGVDLTPSLLSALTMVHVHGPLTLGELAELERVAPPTVTKIVNRLEEQELVERAADESDRRVCRVLTTAIGDELLHASRDRKNAWLAARLAELGPDDLAVLDRAADLLELLLDEGGR